MGTRITKSGDNPRPPKDGRVCPLQDRCCDYGAKCDMCKNNQLKKRSYFRQERVIEYDVSTINGSMY